MKTSDSDLKVYRNIYPDAVTFARMCLIGPKCDRAVIKFCSTNRLFNHWMKLM